MSLGACQKAAKAMISTARTFCQEVRFLPSEVEDGLDSKGTFFGLDLKQSRGSVTAGA